MTSRAHCCDLSGLLCTSYQVSKGAMISSGASHTTDAKPGALNVDNLVPGKCISTDQYVSKVKGWLSHTRRKEKSAHMYTGGTIFVDNIYSVMFVSNQQYNGEHDVFKSQLWKQHCKTMSHQTTEMSGASIYWTDQIYLLLWSFALQYAVDLWNHVPDIWSGLSIIDTFSGIINDQAHLLSVLVRGCPAYVLDLKLQDGKKFPKWSPQKRQGKFLGWSQSHALSVALVHNLCTDSTTPQFHTMMDDWFTMKAREGNNGDFVPPENWNNLLKMPSINVSAEWDTKIDGHYPDLDTKWPS
eukprot:6158952-Ditylum_brightwellii.AAC.1